MLSPAERAIFKKLDTPQKIQDFLDSIPVNVLTSREHTMRSPREVLKAGRAHCLEAAMLAAAMLAYHGRKPLLMDLESAPNDYDHVVAVFEERGRWGAVSKTNYPVERWRDPIYATPRELAMSFAHEYFLESGVKTLRRFSAPFDLSRYDPARWLIARGNVDWVAEALGRARHYAVNPRGVKLRKASRIEIAANKLREWRRDGTRNF